MAKNATSDDLLKSAYEVARDRKIRENHQVMVAMGLAPSLDSTEETTQATAQPVNKRRRLTAAAPVRRIRHQEPDGSAVTKPAEGSKKSDSGIDTYADLNLRAKEEAIKAKIERLIEVHQENGTTYKNPTATYAHTWKRVKSMCDKALERRIRVIERALGQHCIVKMRMFAEVLIIAGKEDLGQLAQEALDRLIEKVGLPREQVLAGNSTSVVATS